MLLRPLQICLLFTATITPYEIALLEPSFDPLFIINRFVDSVFALDILVNFIMMTEKSYQSLSHGTQWVTDPWLIARNYVVSWFFLDIFTNFSCNLKEEFTSSAIKTAYSS